MHIHVPKDKELTAFRVRYNDGSTQNINMAAGLTLREARRYFIGQRFEITETTFHTAIGVDPLPLESSPTR